MSKRISAEFDSIDSAELAARTLRHNVSGILKLSIRARGVNNNTDIGMTPAATIFPAGAVDYNGSSGGLGTPFPAVFFNIGAGGNQNGRQGSDYAENQPVEVPREATLEVLCDDSSVRSVSSHLTSLGGLRIQTH